MQAWLIGFINSWQYAGIALLMFAENLFPPIPSEIVLPFSGLLVAEGELTFWGVWTASTFGATLGAFLWYWIGTFFQREQVIAWNEARGAWLGLKPTDAARAYNWFARYGTMSVFFGRMIPGIRTLISLPAGSVRMPLLRFSLATIAGTMLWNLLLIGIGYFLEQRYDLIAPYIDFVLYTIIAIIAALYLYRVWRQYQRNS